MRFTKSIAWMMQRMVVWGLFLAPILAHAMGGGSSHMGGSTQNQTMSGADNMPMYNSQGSFSPMHSNENQMGNSGTMTGDQWMQKPGEHVPSQGRNGGVSGGAGASGGDGSGHSGGGGGMR